MHNSSDSYAKALPTIGNIITMNVCDTQDTNNAKIGFLGEEFMQGLRPFLNVICVIPEGLGFIDSSR